MQSAVVPSASVSFTDVRVCNKMAAKSLSSTSSGVFAHKTLHAKRVTLRSHAASSSSLRRAGLARAAASNDLKLPAKVAVVGGSGFIGSALVKKLLAEGVQVLLLTRDASRAKRKLGDIAGKVKLVEEKGWAVAVQEADAIVNLAGTPISTRWTPSVKAEIMSSRVETTRKVAQAILAEPVEQRPAVFVSGSAVGFYGVSDTSVFDETSPSGNDYLSEVCRKWEAEAAPVGADGSTRLVIIRTGIVLEKDGGALASMVPLFQLFAGGPLGTGKQWMAWIHRDDEVNLILEAIRNPSYSGVINATAPNPVRFSELCAELGKVLGRPSWLPVPDFAVQTLLGEGASVVLDGQCVLPKRAQELGFQFKYPKLHEALVAIFKS